MNIYHGTVLRAQICQDNHVSLWGLRVTQIIDDSTELRLLSYKEILRTQFSYNNSEQLIINLGAK